MVHTLFYMTDILIILLLVLLNGFFSLSEVALISARRSRLQSDAKAGNSAARTALHLQENPDLFLSTCQVSITVVSILTGIYSGETLADDFAALLASWGVVAEYAPLVAKTTIVIIATYLQVEFGELFPKRIGIDLADGIARAIAPFMMFLAIISKPVVWFLSMNNEVLIKLFHLRAQDQHVTEEEIKSVIEEGTRNGEVQEVEQDIMERVLALGDRRVESLMTHRSDIVSLDLDMTAEEVESTVAQDAFANYPVMDEEGEFVGIVSLKRLVPVLGKPNFSLKEICTQPLVFPDTMTAYKALEELKSRRANCAMVCDEFGYIIGILALKDILEALVGSLDEPLEQPDIIERKDHESWIVSGQCPFYDFLEHFDKAELFTDDFDFSTIGGLILEELGHIPHAGEEVEWNDFSLRVIAMDEMRIDKILVRRISEQK